MNIEEQIKEILQKLYVGDSGEIEYKGAWIGFIECDLEEELTNLLKQQREEAVRGFEKWLEYNLQLDELSAYTESRFKKTLKENADYFIEEKLSQQREKGNNENIHT